MLNQENKGSFRESSFLYFFCYVMYFCIFISTTRIIQIASQWWRVTVWKSKLKSTWNIKVSLTYFYKLLIDVSIAPNKTYKLNLYTNYPKNHVWHITWKVFMLHYNTFSPKDEKHFVAFCVILYDIKHVTYIVMRCKFTKNYSLHKLNLFWQKLLNVIDIRSEIKCTQFCNQKLHILPDVKFV